MVKIKPIMSAYGMHSQASEKTVDSSNVSEAEDYERFEYNYGWARSRKFLKQLVKDNIDLSLVEHEILRHTKDKKPKTWRQYFLVCLRSNILQIFMSLLVLLDAGIVISEIVLEIQSLQMYKGNFRTQLEEFRDIVCALMHRTTPSIALPSQCYSNGYEQRFEKTNIRLNFTFYDKFVQNQTSPAQHVNRLKIFTKESNFTNPSPRIENEHHYPLRNHLEKDDELLTDICRFFSHWYRNYGSSIKCFLNSEIDTIIQSIFSHSSSFNVRPKLTVTKNQSGVYLNDKSEDLQVRKATGSHSTTSPMFSTVNVTDMYKNTSVNALNSDSDSIHFEGFCGDSYVQRRQLGARAMHEASEILHYLSIAITALFFLCVLLKLICLGKEFFRDTNEYFDGAIIVASLASDVLYVRYVSETAAAMVVLLLWRIIRIINALMMHKKQQYEFRIAMQKRSRRILGRKMEVVRTEKEMQDKHILALENLLREMGVSSNIVRKCKPMYKKCTKEQTNNALKSIAALTTGFMGGLVGAPSHVQDVISKYGKNKFSSTQNFAPSTLKQSGSLNILSKYQRQSVPRLVHIQQPESKQSQIHQMCNNCGKHTNYSFEDRDHVSDDIKLPGIVQSTYDDNINLNNLFKRPRAYSLNPQEHWNSLQEKQFQSLLLQSESTTKLTKSLQPMKSLDDADMLHEKSDKSTTSIFVRHTSEDTLNENFSTYYFAKNFRGHHFLRTIPNMLKKTLNISKHKTNIVEEEGEISEQSEHINSTEEKQGEKYLLNGKENFRRTDSSHPHSQTTSTVQEILEIDDLSPTFNLSASNEFMNSPKGVIYMKENQNDSYINKSYLVSSLTTQSLDGTLCRLTDVNDNISDNIIKQPIKPTYGINNNVNNIHNKLITNRKESDEQIWILQPGYIWCQNENQAKLSTMKNKYSPSQALHKKKSRAIIIKQLFSRGKTVHKDSKMLWSKNQLTNS